MSKRIFAYEVEYEDRIMHDHRIVIVDSVNDEVPGKPGCLFVQGYYDDDGSDFAYFYGPDAEVVTA